MRSISHWGTSHNLLHPFLVILRCFIQLATAFEGENSKSYTEQTQRPWEAAACSIAALHIVYGAYFAALAVVGATYCPGQGAIQVTSQTVLGAAAIVVDTSGDFGAGAWGWCWRYSGLLVTGFRH